MTDPRHSSETNEHYTPPQIVAPARELMGGIDLDPCSCDLANEVVGAKVYLTEGALFKPWGCPEFPARVFLNPPGGLLHPKTLEPVKSTRMPGGLQALSSQAVYWAKLWAEWQTGNVSAAVFVCFNLEVLRLTQNLEGVPPCLDFPVCYLKARPRFWNLSTPVDKRGLDGSPSHAGAVVYVPPFEPRSGTVGVARFQGLFSPLGKVVIPS